MTPRLRSIKDGPFCWQGKATNRRLREAYDGKKELTSAIATYASLTEYASNKQSERFEVAQSYIGYMSGQTAQTVGRRLREFADLGVIAMTIPPGLKRSATIYLLPPPTADSDPITNDTDSISNDSDLVTIDMQPVQNDTDSITNDSDAIFQPVTTLEESPEESPEESISGDVATASASIKASSEKKKTKDAELETQANAIYEAYPLKIARPYAIKAIKQALKKISFDDLLLKTKAYNTARAGNLEFVPNPATWFNGERYNDDPATWRSGSSAKSAPATSTPIDHSKGWANQ